MEVTHADTCPVSAPDFVPDLTPGAAQKCNCNFFARLNRALMPKFYRVLLPQRIVDICASDEQTAKEMVCTVVKTELQPFEFIAWETDRTEAVKSDPAL